MANNSEKPQTIQGDLRNLPSAIAPLTKMRHWLLWQWEKPKDKWTKPPYQPSGAHAKNNDPATWSTYDTVIGVLDKWDGIGFSLTETEYAAFDIDNCRDPATGVIDPWATDLVKSADTYAEITVSGTGLRVVGLGTGPEIHRKQKAVNGITLETYRRATRFIVITGNQLPGTPSRLANIDPVIDITVVRLDEKNNTKQEYTGSTGPTGSTEIPPRLAMLLHFPNKGAGVPHGSYASRSELTFAFITSAMLRRVKISDEAIIAACLDSAYDGCAIREHCRDEGDRAYVLRQVEHARSKLHERHDSQQQQAQATIKTFRHGEAPAEPGPQLVRNRLPEVGKGLLSGQWGTFKTFMFLDLSCSVIAGGFWTKEPVYRQGGVLVFAPEGAGGIPLRLKAMVEGTLPGVVAGCKDLPKTLTPKSVDPNRLPFEWTNVCPPLVGGIDPLPAMTKVAEQAHERFMREFNLPLVMIGIDTMSAASNSTSDDDNAEWAKIMALMERYAKATGTAVVGVDHYGKNQEVGTRGASAKEANADFVLSTLAERALSGEVRNTRLALRKLRDGPQGFELPFLGRLVDMGVDRHGLPVTSRVIDWKVTQQKRKTATETAIEHALATAIDEHGETIQVEGAEVRAANKNWVRQAFKQAYLSFKPTVSTEAVKKAFQRALVDTEGIATQEDWVYFEEEPM